MKAEPRTWLEKACKHGEKLESEVENIPKIYPDILDIGRENTEEMTDYRHHLGQLNCWRHDILWPTLLGDIFLSMGDENKALKKHYEKGALKRYKRCLPLGKMTFTYPIMADPGGHVGLEAGTLLYQRLMELGDEEAARSSLPVLVNPKYRTFSEISYVYLQIGDKEKANKYLEMAFNNQKEESFGFCLNWLAVQLNHNAIMEATFQKTMGWTDPFVQYHVLEENGKDTTSHLKTLLAEAERKGAYDTAIAAAMLLEDQDECERLMILEKEIGSRYDGSRYEKKMSLYRIDGIHTELGDYKFLSTLLENDYFRNKIQSQIEELEEPRDAREWYFSFGSEEDLETFLAENEMEKIEHIKRRKLGKKYRPSEPSILESMRDLRSILMCRKVLTRTCFNGYKRLKEMQEDG